MLFQNIYTAINSAIGDDAFKSKHRLSPHSFTRHRKLGFSTLILVLLNLRKSAAQVELDQFFKATEERRHAAQVVTKSAFFQARKQLSHTALIDLNRIATDGFYAAYDAYLTWNGFRLCAIDGSMLRLPREADVVNEFGAHPGKAKSERVSDGLGVVRILTC